MVAFEKENQSKYKSNGSKMSAWVSLKRSINVCNGAFFKLCYCAYSAFIVKRFPTVNNKETLLSLKLY